jgi:hypothetical protein
MNRRLFATFAFGTALAACGDDPVVAIEDPGLIGDPVVDDDDGGGTGDIDEIDLDVGLVDDVAPDVRPRLDTGIADAGVDSAGDAVASDTEPQLCVPGAQLCDGDVLVTCSADGTAVGRVRCAEGGGRCLETGPGLAECDYDDAICEPGSSVCTDDLTGSRACTPDGDGYTEPVACPTRCNPRTGLCNPAPVACPDTSVVDLTPGNYTFDLCEGSRDYEASEGDGDCRALDVDGPERVFRLAITRPTDVLIDLRDDDDSLAIDTQLYLRAQCDDPTSQLACSDDIDCAASDVVIGDCNGGVQRRQSRIAARLEPGEYFLVADSLVYDDGTSFECGSVLLRYAAE